MSRRASVILLEFNELTPSVVERYVGEGRLPNFAQFYRESHVYTTDAEESQDKLNPWIQWVTAHSGLSFAEHGVFRLGEGQNLTRKCIWDLASDAGLPVWVCGSMNPRFDTPLNGYLLPDPWTTTVAPYPEELLPYFRFVQRNVQEHTNDHVPLTSADYASFVAFMVTRGLSMGTVGSIVLQLLRERVAGGRWKRAVLLDKLQEDVFRYYYRKLRPALATFFLNSTAHLQHKYWRNMDPERFRIRPDAAEQAEYESAILFGYQQMDALLGRFMALAGRDTTLMLCTALSQQPCLIYEDQGGKTFYRPRDFARVLDFAGVTAAYRVAPVMSEQFHVLFDTEQDAEQAESRLRSLQVNDIPAMFVSRKGASIFSGCQIFRSIGKDAVLHGDPRTATASFLDLFYQADGLKSGMHHPDGFLWIRTPQRRHDVAAEKVPLRSVAPTVLALLRVPVPTYMTAPPLVAVPRRGVPGVLAEALER